MTSPEEVKPITKEVDTIRQCPTPSPLTKLRSFLGLINFCRRFMPGCTQLIQPLIDSTEQKTKEFKLNSETVEAIKQLAEKLA